MFRLRRILITSGRNLAMLWYACRHPATPFAIKAAALLLTVYAFSPIDIVPDAIPILGWLDDVTLLAFGIPALLNRLPDSAREHAQHAADKLFARWKFWRIGR